MKFRTIIFDTETTGLLMPRKAPIEKQPRIIELGALLVDSSGELGSINWLLDPGIELPPEITKITGIKPEDLVGKPKFVDVLPELVEFFKDVDVLIAHNAPFDVGMLSNELARAGCTSFPWPTETICTVQEYRQVFGHRPKLTELYERMMNKPLMQTHRALDDVRALYEALVQDNFFNMIEL